MKKWAIALLLGVSLLVLPGCAAAGVLATRVFTWMSVPSADAAVVLLEPEVVLPVVDEAASLDQGDVLDALQTRLAEIYEKVNPSVVSVQVRRDMGLLSPTGSGSGFVWDAAGHIVTNNHVIADADEIAVRFYDGQVVSAEVVGADPDSDLAVLKVDVPAALLHPVRLADGDQIKVGQLSIAIGNPFGLENSMTVGFVSALGRTLPVDADTAGSFYTIPNIIQTDTSINPGNSGGVLVNAEGEVIGVPTAIVSPLQASVGVGFAVPAVTVARVIPRLVTDGKYRHAWLGISGTTLTPDLAEALGLDADQRGALVLTVLEDSPAARAGFQGSQMTDNGNVPVGGDVIVAFAGVDVDGFDALVSQLSRFAPGDEVVVTVLRDSAEVNLAMTLGTRP